MPKLPLFLTLILLASACASSPESNAPTVESASVQNVVDAAAGSLPVDAAGQPLVARVNGEGITEAQFESVLDRTAQQIDASDPAALRASVLDNLIEQTLIEQAATAENITVSEAALDAEYQANRSLVDSDAAWQQWLDLNGYTDEGFRADLRVSLVTTAMRDQVAQRIPEQVLHVHARHILVDSEAGANEVLVRLQNGEDFGALAASLSRDVTTRDQGGDLGWFVEGELLEPILTQVAFSLADGQIGGPVPTRLGYHVIQKLGSELRELTPERRAMVTQVQFENWLRGLTFNAIVERYLP